MSFEIEIGGENPDKQQPLDESSEVPSVQKQIDSNNILLNNWNSCKHRSSKIEYTKPSCCGRSNETVVGYKCYKLEILDLTPLICERCNFQESK